LEVTTIEPERCRSVRVAAVLGVHGVETDVVEADQIDGEEPSEFLLGESVSVAWRRLLRPVP
jgi:hypothetical protein